MNPFRTQVKVFVDEPEPRDLAPFAGVFQRWIQAKALEGQLIDVADYRHVFDGPGVVLIGYDSDYSLERRDGCLGLLYTRKRRSDEDIQAQLRASLRLALAACHLLESEAVFQPRLKFRPDELEIRYPDRLRFPNRPETWAAVEGDLTAVLAEVYGPGAFQVAPVEHDSRYLFTVRVHAPNAASLADLLPALRAPAG